MIHSAAKYFCIFLLAPALVLCDSMKAFGQKWSDEVWLIDGKKKLSDPFKKWRAEFQFDGRRTVLPGENAQIGAFRFGAEYKRVHRFGIGIYNWASPIATSGVDFPIDNVAESNYKFGYAALYYERVMFFNRKWEAVLTAHIGNGTIERSYRLESENRFKRLDDIKIHPLELSTSGFYHLTWWLSVGGGFGYRFMRKAPEELKEAFSAPVYIAKVKIRIGKLVKSIYKPGVKDEY